MMLKKGKKTLILILICITILCAVTAFLLANNKSLQAHASTGNGTTVDVSYDPSMSTFTDVKFIANADYFRANPKHAANDGSDNAKGTCTTVAMQMLMGYHNYYSDRRLIPEMGENSRRFLSIDYGDINSSPLIMPTVTSGYGRTSIGTDDGLYKEIFDLTWLSDWEGIGQAIYLVKDGAVKFVNKYSPIKDNVSITAGRFSEETAREEIDAGRPVMLGMAILSDKNFHVVNAYGYAKYNGELGFITHYGYGETKTQIWVPSSWFGFQVTMNVEHTHNLKDTERNVKDTFRELHCDTCGYTGVDKLYNVSEDGEATLKKNYSLKEAITVPQTIYGIEIASIGNSAFANQTDITSITLPYTVERIGNSAFYGCGNLSMITVLYNVTSIGNNAFENCYKLSTLPSISNIENIGSCAFKGCELLSYVYIPSTIKHIGDGAFAGCKNLNIHGFKDSNNYCVEDNILYTKDKKSIVATGKVLPDITIPSTVTNINAYAFAGNSNLETLHIDAETSIGACAFANCENLTSVYFDSFTVPQISANAFVENDFTLYVPHSKQAEYISAFVGYTYDIKSIQITVTFIDDDETVASREAYYGETILGLPDRYKEGYDFGGWYGNADYTGKAYQYNGVWDSTENLTVYAKWVAKQSYITFLGNGIEEFEDKLVTYDEPIGQLPTPTKIGYTFVGWKDEHNVPYDENTIWKRTSGLSLTADFKVNEYTIFYNGNGGTPTSISEKVSYGKVINILATASRDGYTFTGWNTQADGNGDSISAPYTYNITEDLRLYAQFTKQIYNVILEPEGGIDGTTGVNATTDSPMPTEGVTAPTRTGYTFKGYYTKRNGDGFQYYNANMGSEHVWDLPDQTKLYAYWTPNQYTVKLDTQNDIGEIHSITVTYNSPMPTEGVTAPIYKGYTFGGYYTEPNGAGTQYYDANMSSVNSWASTELTTLYAHWTATQYNVTLNKNGGSGGDDSVEATYNVAMPSATAPERYGYNFKGYYINPNDESTKYYDENMSSVKNCDRADDFTLFARWEGIPSKVTFDMQGGSGWSTETLAYYGSDMPTSGLIAPTRTDYIFKGYYEYPNGVGKKYYDGPSMESVHVWDKIEDTDLYAYWEKIYYTVTLHYSDGMYGEETVSVAYGEPMPIPSIYAPVRRGYEFVGYYSKQNGEGTQYYSMSIQQQPSIEYGTGYFECLVSNRTWDQHSDGILYVHWKLLECDYTYSNVKLNQGSFDENSTVHLKHGISTTITAKNFSGYKFAYFYKVGKTYTTQTVEWSLELERSEFNGEIRPKEGFFAVYEEDKCVAKGTLITLANGEQVPVEQLKGDEILLVWNLYTGTFDTAPILFIDNDPLGIYEVINLYFSDGTQVKVLSEHAFWDFDLNRYVYLDKNASEYIGHWFNKQTTKLDGTFVSIKVQLTGVVIQNEHTVAYSPVTYGHLCYYVDGMLSMPGGISGLFNIFEVNSETLKIDGELMQKDIETYGVYTYEEFAEIYPISEEIFEAFGGQYLKISIGKGLITLEKIGELINHYAEFLN